jgi:multisubunit Na+/H+ antiporter MnhC subunit
MIFLQNNPYKVLFGLLVIVVAVGFWLFSASTAATQTQAIVQKQLQAQQ